MPSILNALQQADALKGYRGLAWQLKAAWEAIMTTREEAKELAALRNELLERRKTLLSDLENEEATTGALKLGVGIEQCVLKLEERNTQLPALEARLRETLAISIDAFRSLAILLRAHLVEITVSELAQHLDPEWSGPALPSRIRMGGQLFELAQFGIRVTEFDNFQRFSPFGSSETENSVENASRVLDAAGELLERAALAIEKGFQPPAFSLAAKARADQEAAERHALQMRVEQEVRSRRSREEHEALVARGQQEPGVTFHTAVETILVFGKDVELQPHSIGRYGRLVAILYVDGCSPVSSYSNPD
jgi:hypothetical protein